MLFINLNTGSSFILDALCSWCSRSAYQLSSELLLLPGVQHYTSAESMDSASVIPAPCLAQAMQLEIEGVSSGVRRGKYYDYIYSDLS